MMRAWRRWPRWKWLVVAAVILAGAPVAWYLGSPLFINRVVDEPFPGGSEPSISRDATIPDGMTRQQVEDEMQKAAQTDVSADEAMPAAGTPATALARGMFASADGVHKGKGTAMVYRIGDELVLRFEAFRSTNGPDLYVLLARHAAPKTSADVRVGSMEVARLKGNIGSQNYALPRDLDLAAYKTVVIYCRRFHVVFSTASLLMAP